MNEYSPEIEEVLKTYTPRSGNGVNKHASLETHDMSELAGKTFTPLQWIVPRYIPEGVTLLSGKPKVGKSWLVFAAALAAGEARSILGEACPKRDVLYCALEDNERRMQDRGSVMLGTPDPATWPDNVHIAYKLSDLDHGGIDQLQAWVDTHPRVSLIIIDTLVNIRGRRLKDEDQYQADYRTMKALFDFSQKTGISIIVVHHIRKATAEDIFEMISGTYGLSAAADTLIVLTRTNDQLRLATRGRDIEPEDKLLDFDSETGEWTITGDYEAEDKGAGKSKQTIYAALGTEDCSMTPAQVAQMTGLKEATVRGTLRRMAKAGEIKRTGYGSYHV